MWSDGWQVAGGSSPRNQSGREDVKSEVSSAFWLKHSFPLKMHLQATCVENPVLSKVRTLGPVEGQKVKAGLWPPQFFPHLITLIPQFTRGLWYHFHFPDIAIIILINWIEFTSFLFYSTYRYLYYCANQVPLILGIGGLHLIRLSLLAPREPLPSQFLVCTWGYFIRVQNWALCSVVSDIAASLFHSFIHLLLSCRTDGERHRIYTPSSYVSGFSLPSKLFRYVNPRDCFTFTFHLSDESAKIQRGILNPIYSLPTPTRSAHEDLALRFKCHEVPQKHVFNMTVPNHLIFNWDRVAWISGDHTHVLQPLCMFRLWF